MNPTEDDFRLLPETDRYLKLRTINSLLRGRYFTVEQIMMATTDDLMKLRGFGAQALLEVAQWREALMAPDPELYREMHRAVVAALHETGSVVAETQAPYVMKAVWRVIAQGPFTASRLRQLLIPAEVQS